MESQIIIVFYDNDSNAFGGPYSLINVYKDAGLNLCTFKTPII